MIEAMYSEDHESDINNLMICDILELWIYSLFIQNFFILFVKEARMFLDVGDKKG